jgi:Protein of unknown function (DUF3224)
MARNGFMDAMDSRHRGNDKISGQLPETGKAMKFLVAILFATLFFHAPAFAQTPKENRTVHHATGSFEVKVVPSEVTPIAKEGNLGSMTIDKVFSGGLEATSKGQMLTGMTADSGSMSYVALERVTGKLDGRSGSFLLSHTASMMKSDPKSAVLSVTVVPSSGTGELAGLTGKMAINIDAGHHSYDFEYSLP